MRYIAFWIKLNLKRKLRKIELFFAFINFFLVKVYFITLFLLISLIVTGVYAIRGFFLYVTPRINNIIVYYSNYTNKLKTTKLKTVKKVLPDKKHIKDTLVTAIRENKLNIETLKKIEKEEKKTILDSLLSDDKTDTITIINGRWIPDSVFQKTAIIVDRFLKKNLYTPGVYPEIVKKSKRIIIAVKKHRQLYLVFFDESQKKWKIYRHFNIGYGEIEGKKQRVGDKKTPEGIYFIIQKIDNPSKFSNIYGKRALVLNYPNRWDRKEGRTGYGIWIHGVEIDSGVRNTNGCIALSNKEIEELYSLVDTLTPVLILPDLDMKISEVIDTNFINQEEYWVKKEFHDFYNNILSMIEAWRDSWQNKNIDSYISFYSKDFVGKGMNVEQWREYKKRVFENTKWIELNLDDIVLLKYDSLSSMVQFIQKYKSNKLNSVSIKKLILKKEDGKWKIYRELVGGS